MTVSPTQFHLEEAAKTLRIHWDDDREDLFALAYLRGWCPCAHCQGHFVMEKRFIEGVDTRLVDVQPVGSYAVRLVWGDGHQSGIFAYEYLREIAVEPPGDGPTNDSLVNAP